MGPLRLLWGLTVFSTGAAVSYRVFLREHCLTWGARPEESRAPMPGDDLVSEATVVATRALTIAAPVDVVWSKVRILAVLPRSEPAAQREVFENERAIVFSTEDGRWSWACQLLPDGAAHTRCVLRNRSSSPQRSLVGRLFAPMLTEPPDLARDLELLHRWKAQAEAGDASAAASVATMAS